MEPLKFSLVRHSRICLMSALLVIVTLVLSENSRAGDIVVYKKVETEQTKLFRNSYERYFEFEPFVETVPGGLSKFRDKTKSYIVLDLSTGNYREITYGVVNYYSDLTESSEKAKAYEVDSEDSELFDIFETDPTIKKNLLVVSFIGTGSGENHEDHESTGGEDTYHTTEVQTLSGLIKTQRIKLANGTVSECDAPSKISGNGVKEWLTEEAYTGENKWRYYITTKTSLVLDKKRTRDFLNDGGTTLEDAANAVTDYLMTKGYVDEDSLE